MSMLTQEFETLVRDHEAGTSQTKRFYLHHRSDFSGGCTITGEDGDRTGKRSVDLRSVPASVICRMAEYIQGERARAGYRGVIDEEF